jgi:hypothetical protein
MRNNITTNLALSVVLLISFIIFIPKLNLIKPNESKTANEIEILQVDNLNDGVYYDNENNYKFEYPDEIFAYTDSTQPDRNEWVNKELPFSSEDSHNALFLSTKVYGNWVGDYSNIENTIYDKIATLPEGSTFYDDSGNELGVIMDSPPTKEPGVIYYYYKIPKSYPMNKNYVYKAEWLKYGKVYSIYMLSLSKDVLESNRQVFEKIMGSFEFTN